jgi:hypothetical protein
MAFGYQHSSGSLMTAGSSSSSLSLSLSSSSSSSSPFSSSSSCGSFGGTPNGRDEARAAVWILCLPFCLILSPSRAFPLRWCFSLASVTPEAPMVLADAINGAPTLVGGLSSFWPPQLAASKKLASSQAQNDPNANAQSAPRSASRFGASGMVQFSGLWSGLRYSVESRLRYSAESQYSPTPPITADVTVQPFQAAAMK